MQRRAPISTRTATLVPYTALFLSRGGGDPRPLLPLHSAGHAAALVGRLATAGGAAGQCARPAPIESSARRAQLVGARHLSARRKGPAWPRRLPIPTRSSTR